MNALAIDGIAKRFGTSDILADVSLSIDAGEFMVLLGPSGCGKSTLLNIIAGLEAADRGRIRIGGVDVTEQEPGARDIAMVFQSYALYPTMTVRGNMSCGMARHDAMKRVEDAARLLQIDGLLDRRPAQLSGGQRQRVAIGRAIVRRPTIFLFDEPLSNLDAKLRAETRLELKELHRRLGATIVYVTHDQIEAMTLATRIAVMNRGVIEQVGTPREIYDRPVTAFIAGFTGSPPMNLISGIVSNVNGERLFRPDGIDVPMPLPEAVIAAAHVAGRKLLLGLRPEHVGAPETIAGARRHIVELMPLLVEPTGADCHIVFAFGAAKLVGRFKPHVARAAGPMTVALDLAHAALFEAGTGRRL
jgi:multiple sugar transport system ATP-binding protein